MTAVACSIGCESSRERAADRPLDLDALIAASARGEIVEALAARIARGLRPQTLLAALHGAAIRNVVPSRVFSTEHHILPALHSVAVASEVVSARVRWYPLLWAADYFAWARGAEDASGPMRSLDRARLPSRRAQSHLEGALDAFDGPRAEEAAASMWRAGEREPLAAVLRRYAARDFREIGHKQIHVSSALSMLSRTRGAHGEEVARSTALVLALGGEEDGHDVDATWDSNRARAARLGEIDEGTSHDHGVVVELVHTLRGASPDEASEAAFRALERGIAPRAIWDAMTLRSAELAFDHPLSTESLHAVTSSNAAYTAYLAADRSERDLILLQNAAHVADFRVYVEHWAARRNRPAASALALDTLAPGQVPARADELVRGFGAESFDERLDGAQRTLAWASASRRHERELFTRVFETVAMRIEDDSHDYKLAAAVYEDCARLSPRWRARYLAACTARLRASGPQSALYERIGRAL